MSNGSKRLLHLAGLPRAGKSTIGRLLLETGIFFNVAEPFSNYRGSDHRSKIIKNLQHTFTYINKNNEDLFLEDVSMLGSEPTYIYRKCFDGGFSLRRALSFGSKIGSWAIRKKRLAVIDDSFLTISIPWLRERLGWQTIIMTRHPLDFVGEFKRLGFGFDLTNFVKQQELMTGALKNYEAEISELVEGERALTLPEQSAYLWKYLHICTTQYLEGDAGIVLLRFEDMKGKGYRKLEGWLQNEYGLKMLSSKNPFEKFNNNERKCLTKDESEGVLAIVGDIKKHFYAD